MTKRRIMFGLTVMIGVQISSEILMTTFGVDQSLYGAALSMLVALLSAFAGGWMARSNFLIPALVLWAALWCSVLYILYRIAAPLDSTVAASIFRYNVAAIACSGVAVAIGAALGQALAQRRGSRNAAA